VGLKAMREKRGLTQRKLAHDLGISQNYIPPLRVTRVTQDQNSNSRWSATSAVGSRTCSRSS
jgi:predicted transcriptional regulator